jgi:hypothetical protein
MILAVDPGKMTGIVVLDERVPLVIEFYQLSFAETVRFLDLAIPYADAVVVERYDITGRTASLSRQLDALLVIGFVTGQCELEGRRLRMQGRSDAKTAFSDRVLRRLELFDAVTGPHARDALRHALLAVRTRVTPACVKI